MAEYKHLPQVVDLDVCKALIEKFGSEYQIDRAIEEMSELTKELLKQRRVDRTLPDNKTRHNISEEMADVIITLTELLEIFDNEEEISEEIKYKLNRARTMLETSDKS